MRFEDGKGKDSVARTFFVKTARFWTIFRKPAHFPAHKFVQNPHILDQNVKNPHNFYLVRFYCFQGKTLKFCKKCPGQYFYFIFMPQFLNKICYFRKKNQKFPQKFAWKWIFWHNFKKCPGQFFYSIFMPQFLKKFSFDQIFFFNFTIFSKK